MDERIKAIVEQKATLVENQRLMLEAHDQQFADLDALLTKHPTEQGADGMTPEIRQGLVPSMQVLTANVDLVNQHLSALGPEVGQALTVILTAMNSITQQQRAEALATEEGNSVENLDMDEDGEPTYPPEMVLS